MCGLCVARARQPGADRSPLISVCAGYDCWGWRAGGEDVVMESAIDAPRHDFDEARESGNAANAKPVRHAQQLLLQRIWPAV